MAGVLQHLRSSTLDKRPNPASMVDGQVAINYASGSPGMFFKDSNGDLVKVGPVHVGTTAPNVSPASGGTAGNSKGEQWLDTTGGTYVFKIWDGSAWRSETGEFVNVTGDTMTGALGIVAGSASTPGLFFSGDANTGVYAPSADQLAITTGGTARLMTTTTAITSALPVDVPLGSASAPSLTFTGDTNTGIYSPGADQVAISTNGSARLYIASDGKAGVGTTQPVALLQVGTGNTSTPSAKSVFNTNDTANAAIMVSNWSGSPTTNGPRIYFDNSGRGRFDIGGGNGTHSFVIRDNEAASDRLTIDSSGRLLVGTSTSLSAGDGQFAKMQMVGNSFSASNNAILALGRGEAATSITTDEVLGALLFTDNAGGEFARIQASADAAAGSGDYPGRLVFSTTADGASFPTGRLRISNDGSTTIFSNLSTLSLRCNAAQGTSHAYLAGYSNSGGFDTGNIFFIVYNNGNVQNANNSYGAISDLKLKENIVDAGSQWSDIKALQVRKYNLKEGQTHTQIGLIAQEVELVSPGLVSESPDRDAEGNDLGTVTKSVNYSVLYMKAVKALQEAMERIEILEAKVAALESA